MSKSRILEAVDAEWELVIEQCDDPREYQNRKERAQEGWAMAYSREGDGPERIVLWRRPLDIKRHDYVCGEKITKKD